MKKISALLLAISCGLSFSVAHAATSITGIKIEGGTSGTCNVLDEPVAPSQSKDVKAAYDCDFAKNNMIRVAACHIAGRKKVETLPCTQIGIDGDNAPIFADSACTATTDTVDTTVNIGKGFVGTNAGGGIAATPLAAACDAGPIETLATIP